MYDASEGGVTFAEGSTMLPKLLGLLDCPLLVSLRFFSVFLFGYGCSFLSRYHSILFADLSMFSYATWCICPSKIGWQNICWGHGALQLSLSAVVILNFEVKKDGNGSLGSGEGWSDEGGAELAKWGIVCVCVPQYYMISCPPSLYSHHYHKGNTVSGTSGQGMLVSTALLKIV